MRKLNKGFLVLVLFLVILCGIGYKLLEGTDNRLKIAEAVLYSDWHFNGLDSNMPVMTAALTARFPVGSKSETVLSVFQALDFECKQDTNRMTCKSTLFARFPCGSSMIVEVDIDKQGLLSQIRAKSNTLCV